MADHPPLPVALSYRFNTVDRSVVFSGDTRKTDALIDLAKGADVFVCEAQYLPGTRQVLDAGVKVGRFDKETADNLFTSISSHALTVEQAGEVAQAAGVNTLVLSHFVPGDGAVPDQVFVDEARKAFSGEIIAGRGLTRNLDFASRCDSQCLVWVNSACFGRERSGPVYQQTSEMAGQRPDGRVGPSADVSSSCGE
ncbi:MULTISPECIES: MBL fold metallo-hydrolase [unclassified Bradyrhizobium]|uniref:MBL fold metallo-hydrolase n=1 Tax=unclassified Bradyrhizobium TaxID=2631580 RepID=UPI0033936F2E